MVCIWFNTTDRLVFVSGGVSEIQDYLHTTDDEYGASKFAHTKMVLFFEHLGSNLFS